jgi:hypothetical protein
MKKNLFIAALAFVAMGANAQVVNTIDGYQAGDQFEQDGIKYELLEVGNGNPVKVVEAAATSVIVQKEFNQNDTYTVTDFSGSLANKDLEEVTAAPAEPITIAEGFFSAATYEAAILTIPDGSFKAYTQDPVWFKFLAKKTQSGTIMGDAAGDDGIVDLDDVAALFAMFEEYIMEGDDEYKAELDMNGDGVIDLDDVSFAFAIFEAYPW